jgi:hypothetical protein
MSSMTGSNASGFEGRGGIGELPSGPADAPASSVGPELANIEATRWSQLGRWDRTLEQSAGHGKQDQSL